MEAKKVFISYSWSSQEHEERVLDLATDLRENGVDAILDKWDLREGEDADKFMESMVSDETISKVLIVSDKQYAVKSDKRKGGAGTEAQIISRKIYEQTDEKKFVVAAFEVNEETGKPYLPVYYGSRKYIDFTDQSKQVEKFEELIRWINDKPLYVKPELGKTPEYILAEEKKSLQTGAHHKRVLSLYTELKPNRTAALRDYLDVFVRNMTAFQIRDINNKQYDDIVWDSIAEFLPYRDEWIEVVACVYKNDADTASVDLYMRFFEEMQVYTHKAIGVQYPYDGWHEENMKFILQELFLYYIAILIKFELFDGVSKALNTVFFNRTDQSGYDYSYTYYNFQQYLHSFEHRNKRLSLRRLSLLADTYSKRAKSEIVSFEDIMQADFTLYIHYLIAAEDTNNDWMMKRWWPDTLLYARNYRHPFEIYVRSESARYFDKVKIMLGINNKDELKNGLAKIKDRKAVYPTWDGYGFNYDILSNIENIASKA